MQCRSTLRLVVDCGVWPGQADLSAGHVLVAVASSWLCWIIFLLFSRYITVYNRHSSLLYSGWWVLQEDVLQYLFEIQEYDSCPPQSHGKESNDWWVVKQWATQHRHIAFAGIIFSRRQHNKQEEGSDWLGWSIASFYSSRFAPDNREWYQWTGRHFRSSLLSESLSLIIDSAQHCVVTLDVQNSRSVPWNQLVEKSWYRTRIRQATKKNNNKMEQDPYCTE